ncbi:MAG: CBS domain-containing protein, partial [Alphaproteobacteria bacterium]
RGPQRVGPDTLAAPALQKINSSAITSLMVVEEGKPVGLVHLHDLLRIGVA